MLVGEFTSVGRLGQEADWSKTPHVPVVVIGPDAKREPDIAVQIFTAERQLISEKTTDGAGRAIFTLPTLGTRYIVRPLPKDPTDAYNPEELEVQSIVVASPGDWDNPKFAAFFQKAKKGPAGLMTLIFAGATILGGLWALSQIAIRYGGNRE